MVDAPKKRAKTDGVTRPKVKHTIIKMEMCGRCRKTILTCYIAGWPRTIDPTPLNPIGVAACTNRTLYVKDGNYADLRDHWNQTKGDTHADVRDGDKTVHVDHTCGTIIPLVLARNIVAEKVKPTPTNTGEPNY